MNASLRLSLHSLWITLVFGQTQHLLYGWKYMDFDWQSDQQKEQYIKEGKYNKSAVVPIDVYMGNEIFLGIPRAEGVPGSLVTLNTAKKEGGGPLLRPYPDWSWTDGPCNRSIVSVYRVAVDRCNILWVLDNGKVGEDQKCPPKIVAFDLGTNKLFTIKEIPKEYAFNKEGKGLLVTPIVETYDHNCKKLTMYIADVEGYGLIVWDGKDRFKRYESKDFAPDMPNFTLNGDSFYLADGILGMALTPGSPSKKVMYFSALASQKLYHVPVKELAIDSDKEPNYVEDKGDVNVHKAPLVIVDSTMYFCSLEDNALMAWDVRKPFTKKNLKTIYKNNQALQFVSGLKSTRKPHKSIYGISNKYQKSATNTRDINDYNFFIFQVRID